MMYTSEMKTGQVWYKLFKNKITFYIVDSKKENRIHLRCLAVWPEIEKDYTGSSLVMYDGQVILDKSDSLFKLVTDGEQKRVIRKMFGVFDD